VKALIVGGALVGVGALAFFWYRRSSSPATTATQGDPLRGKIAILPPDGGCPSAWFLEDALCRRLCVQTADCPRGTLCVDRNGQKRCTTDV
jgi:hypothetical protein